MDEKNFRLISWLEILLQNKIVRYLVKKAYSRLETKLLKG